MVSHKSHTQSEISAALKKRLRTLRWQPEAIMREVVLIQRLRELALFEQPSAQNPVACQMVREELVFNRST